MQLSCECSKKCRVYLENPFGKLGRIWDDNSKRNFKETGKIVDWIDLVQRIVHLRAVGKVKEPIRVP